MNKLQALELSTGLANLVTGMEEELLRNIAAYLLSGKAETESGKWKIRKLAELGKLNKKNIETIKSYIPFEKDMAELTLKRAAVDAFAHAESGFRRMVIDRLVKDAPTGSMDATMQRTLKMLGKQAATDLNLVNTTMQIKARQMANTAVHKAASLAGNQDFLDMLNRAAGKTVTGTESMTAAVSTCLKDMAQKGIPGFVDRSGRKWTPEAYVNMCVRTTASNTAHQAMFERMKDYKQRIIEVSSHSGARPKCAKDQGKLYDLDNGSGYVEDVNGKKIRYYAFSSTSYGKPDGLFGINCRHKMYPFVPGCSTQTYFPYDEEENAAQYKKVQKQRELERKVRASKRECMMLKDGDPEMFQKASVKLKHNTQQLKTYCSSNDLTYMNERTTVMGYGRSEAGKVTAAYNRALKQEQEKLNKVVDISGGSGIIGIERAMAAKSFDKAAEYARKELGASISSLSELPLETVNVINSSMHRLYQEIPTVKGAVSEIVLNDMTEIAKASVSWLDNAIPSIRIKLNRSLLQTSSIDEIEQHIAQIAAAHELTPKDGLYGLFLHESVHVREYMITAKKCSNQAEFKLSLDNFEEAKSIMDTALSNCGLSSDKRGYERFLSEYATQNPAEFIAEAFSSTESNALVLEVKRLLKKKWGM